MRAFIKAKPAASFIRQEVLKYKRRLESMITFNDSQAQSYFNEAIDSILDISCGGWSSTEDIITFCCLLGELTKNEQYLHIMSRWTHPKRWAAFAFLIQCWIDLDDAIEQISEDDALWDFTVSELAPSEIHIGGQPYTCMWPSEEEIGGCDIH